MIKIQGRGTACLPDQLQKAYRVCVFLYQKDKFWHDSLMLG